MKKLLLVGCFLVGISAVSYAQRATSTPEQSAQALRNELGLNEAQTAKAVAIYAEQSKAMAAAPAPAAVAPGAAGAGRPRVGSNPLIEATNAKLKEILTPEQALTFQYHQDLQRVAVRGN